ncbi:MAG: SDR family oxidoreductase [Gammaproteobacteria bacterium]
MGRIDGRTAIVTGASSGIGRATARLLAAEGARVVVGARRDDELRALVAEIEADGGEAAALAGDVTEESYAAALVALAVDRFGGLDIAVNNVGTLGPQAALTTISLADWNHTLAVNLTSAFLGARHQVPAIAARGGGALVFTGTFVGHTAAFPGLGAYGASKSGLIGLTQGLAVDHGEQGVRVNAVLPGATNTEMFREHNPSAEAQSFIGNLTALRRIAEPEEIARAVLYLAADATFTTGTALLCDGGVSINHT